MSQLLRLELGKIDQMQENELLHLINIQSNYSRKIIKYVDPDNESVCILVDQSQNTYTLRKLIENLKPQQIKKEKFYKFFIHLLNLITEQLIELEDLLIQPNLALLTVDLILCQTDNPENKIFSDTNLDLFMNIKIAQIKWLILPDSLIIDKLSALTSGKDIWTYFIKLDKQRKEFYLNHKELIQNRSYQDAMNLLQSKLRPSSTKQEKKIEITKKDSNIKKRQKQNKKGFFSKFLPNFKKSYIANSDIGVTVPLNPQEDLFRLAMICEGPPGTIAENEGLKAFILIDEFLIGRDRTICDFILQEKSVGRIHARISRHGSHYFLEDLGSVNGTFLDNKKLNKHQTYLLADQCRLKFAERTFYFNID